MSNFEKEEYLKKRIIEIEKEKAKLISIKKGNNVNEYRDIVLAILDEVERVFDNED